MDALNVLHVTPYYDDAWGYGGIPRAVTALARGLARRGHRVTVVTTDAGTASTRAARPPEVVRDDVRVLTFPNVSNALAYHAQLFAPVGLRRCLARHAGEFDVAHVHACHHLPAAIAARCLGRAGVPWVLSPHGTAGFVERRRLAKRVFDLAFGRRVRRDAALVTALTDLERDELVGLGTGADRIRVVPAALDLDEARPARRAAGGPRVMFLGTLTPRKRLDVLAAAFARLDLPDAELVIAGNDMGTGATIRRTVARLGLAPRTSFPGLLEAGDRFTALAAADVVACPAAHEAFGLVALEALHAGTPVVVAADAGAAGVVRRLGGGLVVPAGDAEALATALAAILADRDRWRAAARAAGRAVRERYAPERVAAEAERLYAEVVGVSRQVTVPA